MARYILSNKAVDDLAKIWNYTYEEWSETQADFYYKTLISSCEKIVSNPKIGYSYNAIANELLGLKVKKHIIFYRINQENTIEIIRFLHVSMDLKNRIRE